MTGDYENAFKDYSQVLLAVKDQQKLKQANYNKLICSGLIQFYHNNLDQAISIFENMQPIQKGCEAQFYSSCIYLYKYK